MAATALADAVLVLHALLALALVALLPLCWAGAAAGWRWVRHPGVRTLHLAGLAVVAALAMLDLRCPLTVLEDRLRGSAGAQTGAIERHVEALLYWDLPTSAFTGAYVAYALATAVTWFVVPPRGATTPAP